jgi:hypothetical protein
LMFGVQRPTAEKCADVDIRCMTARRCVRFMPDEYALRIRLAAQKPPISIGAAVKLSGIDC